MFGLVSLTMAVGYYKLGQGNKERRAEKHEKRMARIALMPMLQVRFAPQQTQTIGHSAAYMNEYLCCSELLSLLYSLELLLLSP